MLAVAKDLGIELNGRLFTDSAAAKGVLSRRGCGKVRHLETPTLWVQKAVQDKRFTLRKVEGKKNPADLGAKHVDQAIMLKHLCFMGLLPKAEVSPEALKAQV